ncbi:MAG: 6-phosphogluconolactonase [DPANN group archaeon]|nr:6-phosphogluconolactonase [DPANN group archaeon]
MDGPNASPVSYASRQAADAAASAWLLERLERILAEKDHAVFGVVGGRSVSGILSLLVQEQLPWEQVHVFLLDERLVEKGSAESNATAIAPLFSRARFHPFLVDGTEQASPLPALHRYEAELAQVGRRFDLILLSAGEDGHIASLFPRHPALSDQHQGFILVEHAPKQPPERMSASKSLIASATGGLLLFYGEGKRHALEMFEDPSVPEDDCPAKIVLSLPCRRVVTDLQERN